jgi:hypothetical protein
MNDNKSTNTIIGASASASSIELKKKQDPFPYNTPLSLDNETEKNTMNHNKSTNTIIGASASASSIELKKTDPSPSTITLPVDNEAKSRIIQNNESTPTGSGTSVSGVSIEFKIIDPSSSTTTLPLDNDEKNITAQNKESTTTTTAALPRHPPVKRNRLATSEPPMQGNITTTTDVKSTTSAEQQTEMASIPPSWTGPPNPNFKDKTPTNIIPYLYILEKDKEAKLAGLLSEDVLYHEEKRMNSSAFTVTSGDVVTKDDIATAGNKLGDDDSETQLLSHDPFGLHDIIAKDQPFDDYIDEVLQETEKKSANSKQLINLLMLMQIMTLVATQIESSHQRKM